MRESQHLSQFLILGIAIVTGTVAGMVVTALTDLHVLAGGATAALVGGTVFYVAF